MPSVASLSPAALERPLRSCYLRGRPRRDASHGSPSRARRVAAAAVPGPP